MVIATVSVVAMTDTKMIAMTEYEQQCLLEIQRVIERGPHQDNWDSLSRIQMPEWFRDAKFGIFVHWGLYSIPAFRNEWYSRNMYIQGYEEWEHHRKAYGDHTCFGYKDFIPLFTADKFDPEAWISLFHAAGAKYIFPVAEHHDGFQMYPSRFSCWNAGQMGPRRDVLGELKCAAQRHGLHFCASSHRAEHWWFMGHGRAFPSDVREPMKKGDFYWPAMPEPDPQDLQSKPYPSEEFLADWLLRTCEIIDNYQPELLYFDWWVQHEAFKPWLKQVAAFYYNRGREWGKSTAICYKHDAMAFGSGIPEVERGGMKNAVPYVWQTETAVAKNAWCHTDSLAYKTAGQILRTLIETVCRGGNLLLNVGPKADGSIPREDEEILQSIGKWMDVNGTAIYGSRPWRKCQEGPTELPEGQFTDNQELPYTSEDIRFTARGDSIYAFVMKWPSSGQVTIRSLAETKDQNLPEFHGLIQEVSILGYEGTVRYTRDQTGLYFQAELRSDLPVVVQIRVL